MFPDAQGTEMVMAANPADEAELTEVCGPPPPAGCSKLRATRWVEAPAALPQLSAALFPGRAD